MKNSLKKYLKDWNLSGPELLAETSTSHVYKVQFENGIYALKLLNDVGIRDEKPGISFLAHCAGQGTVTLIRHDDQALLMEYIDGPALSSVVKDGDDDKATQIIGNLLNTIHSIKKPPPKDLVPLEMRFRALFERADQDPSSIYMRGAKIARELLTNQENICALHGDMHHDNVLRHPEKGWLAIDPKGLVGDPAYDAANTLYNPEGMEELAQNKGRLFKQSSLLAETMQVSHAKLLAYIFAYGCLGASWSLEDGQNPAHALIMAEITESVL